VVHVIATDPAARCHMTGHTYLGPVPGVGRCVRCGRPPTHAPPTPTRRDTRPSRDTTLAVLAGGVRGAQRPKPPGQAGELPGTAWAGW
jgi:hypothetical protein